MKIEFRPDFRIPPVFKAIWPKLREAFKGLRFKRKYYWGMRQRIFYILSILGIVLFLIIVLFKII
jgi:hypothetical protein